MAESIEESDNCSAGLQNTIDANFEKILALEFDRDLLMTKQHQRLTQSQAINELEISFTDELKLLYETKAAVRSEIEAISEVINENRNELTKVRLTKEISGKQKLEEMILYENALEKELPKFRDALRIYNEEYLSNEIAEIRKESRDVQDKIVGLDQKMKAFDSRYKLTEIGNIQTPKEDTVSTELMKFRQICSESNLNGVSARKLYEYSIKEMEEKISLNRRKMARFT